MEKNKEFERLFSFVRGERRRLSSKGLQDLYIESESDKGRVINSAAFRRLQQKAQVFPLDQNAAIRTRLTHSIEVSQNGRYLAQKVLEQCDVHNSLYRYELAAFVNTVESACLLHDIGNPPYGHFGEAAIKEWFTQWHTKGQTTRTDLVEFDGNPQGFRLVSFLAGEDGYGLNLTCSLLLSSVKYPVSRANKGGSKKIGIFDADMETYAAACNSIDWHNGCRFPLVHLMDAADDISYSMSDLEDGLEKGIISIGDLEDGFGKELFASPPALDKFVYFKTSVTREAVNYAAKRFVDNLPTILDGEQFRLIDKESEIGARLEAISVFARRKVYASEPAESVELAGRSVIRGLLDCFSPLLELSGEEFRGLVVPDASRGQKSLDLHERLLRRLPDSYVKHYLLRADSNEFDARCHLIVDFISGMTDHYALYLYQVLTGIRIQ